MVGKKNLYWQYIRADKSLRVVPDYRKEEVRNEIYKICAKLNKKIKKKRHYSFKLGRMSVIRHVYHLYTKTFHCFKNGNGPMTIIGKVSKCGNCEYPNTPYYRITKAWRFL